MGTTLGNPHAAISWPRTPRYRKWLAPGLAAQRGQPARRAGRRQLELEQRAFDRTPKQPHFAAGARAMISPFMQEWPSHLDPSSIPSRTWRTLDGQPFPGTINYDNAAEASACRVPYSLWKFLQVWPGRHRKLVGACCRTSVKSC